MLVCHAGVVVEKRTEGDEVPTRFQDLVNYLQVLYNVVSSVKEEGGCNNVESVDVFRVNLADLKFKDCLLARK